MSERAAYSRVYWSIVDDPKFESVYDNDSHLAAWLRLLLIADQAHPASAHLPSNVRRSSVQVLANVELIDLAPGGRYRVHGLDAERERRKLAATSRPGSGTTRPPDGDRTGTERSPNGPGTTGLRRDETRESRDETDARAEEQEDEVRFWLAKHGCYIRPGNGYDQKLVVAVTHHGSNALIGMMDRLAAAGTLDGDIKGFLFGAIDELDKRARPNLSVLEAGERDEERREAMGNRIAATKRRVHEAGGHVEPNPGCPDCEEASA